MSGNEKLDLLIKAKRGEYPELDDYDGSLLGARWLHYVQESTGLTQDEIAELCGIKQSNLSRIANAKSRSGPNLGTLCRIAKAVGLPPPITVEDTAAAVPEQAPIRGEYVVREIKSSIDATKQFVSVRKVVSGQIVRKVTLFDDDPKKAPRKRFGRKLLAVTRGYRRKTQGQTAGVYSEQKTPLISRFRRKLGRS